jgi:hypothetical protein
MCNHPDGKVAADLSRQEFHAVADHAERAREAQLDTRLPPHKHVLTLVSGIAQDTAGSARNHNDITISCAISET